jgi:ribose 5-phosphate isomerase A
VEVIPFGWRTQAAYLESLGAEVTLRCSEDGSPFHTDQGNLILDCDFGSISAPAQLAGHLNERAGIVEHGLFLGLVSDVIVGTEEGIRHLRKQDVQRRT